MFKEDLGQNEVEWLFLNKLEKIYNFFPQEQTMVAFSVFLSFIYLFIYLFIEGGRGGK